MAGGGGLAVGTAAGAPRTTLLIDERSLERQQEETNNLMWCCRSYACLVSARDGEGEAKHGGWPLEPPARAASLGCPSPPCRPPAAPLPLALPPALLPQMQATLDAHHVLSRMDDAVDTIAAQEACKHVMVRAPETAWLLARCVLAPGGFQCATLSGSLSAAPPPLRRAHQLTLNAQLATPVPQDTSRSVAERAKRLCQLGAALLKLARLAAKASDVATAFGGALALEHHRCTERVGGCRAPGLWNAGSCRPLRRPAAKVLAAGSAAPAHSRAT